MHVRVAPPPRRFVRSVVRRREPEIADGDRIPDDLREQAKTMGLFGNKQKQIHSIAALTSITLDQSSFGTRYNYGDIVLNLDRLGVNEQIVLKNIDHPDAVIKNIRSKVTAKNKK